MSRFRIKIDIDHLMTCIDIFIKIHPNCVRIACELRLRANFVGIIILFPQKVIFISSPVSSIYPLLQHSLHFIIYRSVGKGTPSVIHNWRESKQSLHVKRFPSYFSVTIRCGKRVPISLSLLLPTHCLALLNFFFERYWLPSFILTNLALINHKDNFPASLSPSRVVRISKFRVIIKISLYFFLQLIGLLCAFDFECIHSLKKSCMYIPNKRQNETKKSSDPDR